MVFNQPFLGCFKLKETQMAKCPKCCGPVVKAKLSKLRSCPRHGPIYMTVEQYTNPERAALVYQLRQGALP